MIKQTLPITGLITKLIASDVVKKQDGDLTFTSKFSSYLFSYAKSNPTQIETILGLQDMLCGFDPTLSDLSANEISAIVVLMDYNFSNTQAATPTQ